MKRHRGKPAQENPSQQKKIEDTTTRKLTEDKRLVFLFHCISGLLQKLKINKGFNKVVRKGRQIEPGSIAVLFNH